MLYILAAEWIVVAVTVSHRENRDERFFAIQARCAVDKTYQPDFSRAFDHFLLHTGGRGVLEALEASLKLKARQIQPSKDTLWRFGNTSAASTWYILSRIESSSGIKKGDRIWQLGYATTPLPSP